MTNSSTYTVKITAPAAQGFDRVFVIPGGDDERTKLVDHDETSVTLEITPEAVPE